MAGFEHHIKKHRKLEINNLEKYVKEIVDKKNSAPVKDFENYSPNEMQLILYDFFSARSIVQFNKLESSKYLEIPLLNQILFLSKIIIENKELKLTATGKLPTKIVSKIYQQGYLKDYAIENGISKLYGENSVATIELTRIILELSSLVKKKNNKLSITKKGEKILEDPHTLFLHIFEVFTTKFNWGYFDNYENDEIGQMGFGFSLILLNKYGSKMRDSSFYAEKYLKAFNYTENVISEYSNENHRMYEVRTYNRFLKYFGLVEIKEGESILDSIEIKTTQLFKELIKIRMPKNR